MTTGSSSTFQQVGAQAASYLQAGVQAASYLQAGVQAASYLQAGVQAASYPQAGVQAASYPQAGYPQAGVQAASYPQAGYPQAGYSQTGVQAVVYPQAGVQAVGYPQAAAQAAGYQQPGVQATGSPQVAVQAAGYPQAGLQVAGYPQAGVQAASYPEGRIRSLTFDDAGGAYIGSRIKENTRENASNEVSQYKMFIYIKSTHSISAPYNTITDGKLTFKELRDKISSDFNLEEKGSQVIFKVEHKGASRTIESFDENKVLAQVLGSPNSYVNVVVHKLQSHQNASAHQSELQKTGQEALPKNKKQLGGLKKGYSYDNCSVADVKKKSNHLHRSPVGHEYSASSEKSPGVCGLRNIGNTCFMNSAIQCLSNIDVLTRYFMNKAYLDDINQSNELGTKGNVAKAYAELITRMWSQTQTSIEPNEMKRQIAQYAPQFSDFRQQDSHEFMNFLIDALHEDLKDNTGSSFISKLFHGTMTITVRCARSSCGKSLATKNNFTFLSLPLKPQNHKEMTVERCMKIFLKSETLGENGQWLCQWCEEKSDAHKTIRIEKFPKILILHLKRFDFELVDKKIDTEVIYPEQNLDLNKYCKAQDGTANYSLIAVSKHQGLLKGGHYTTAAKNFKDKKWYNFDDSYVTSTSIHNKEVSKDAYVLVYQQLEN